MLGTLITVGGNLLGGLLGRSSAKKAQRRANAREDTKVQRLVADASAAGISPLAALGSGAASYQAPTIQAPDLGSAVGEGIGSLAHYFSSEGKAERQAASQVRSLEMRKLAAETAAAEQSVVASARSASFPQAYNSLRPVGLAEDGLLPVGALAPAMPAMVGGKVVKTDPRFSDSEVIESRYGDVAQSIYGSALAAHELGRHVGGQMVDGVKIKQAVARRGKPWLEVRDGGKRVFSVGGKRFLRHGR